MVARKIGVSHGRCRFSFPTSVAMRCDVDCIVNTLQRLWGMKIDSVMMMIEVMKNGIWKKTQRDWGYGDGDLKIAESELRWVFLKFFLGDPSQLMKNEKEREVWYLFCEFVRMNRVFFRIGSPVFCYILFQSLLQINHISAFEFINFKTLARTITVLLNSNNPSPHSILNFSFSCFFEEKKSHGFSRSCYGLQQQQQLTDQNTTISSMDLM